MDNLNTNIDRILAEFPHTKHVNVDILYRKSLKKKLLKLFKSNENTTEASKNSIRSYNIGESDYSKRSIQPWDIILMYNLNFFDGSILKYLLRKKFTEPREKDYEKIIHYCQERLRQIEETKLK